MTSPRSLPPAARRAALFLAVPTALFGLLHLAAFGVDEPAAAAADAAAVAAAAADAAPAAVADAAPVAAADAVAVAVAAPPPPPPPPPDAARAIARSLTPPESPLALVHRAHPGVDGRLEATLPDGRTARLSLDPALQQRMKALLADYDVPYAALVALDPRTGRLLAVVEHSSEAPAAEAGLAARPIAPAASVFKVVTSAALLEQGVSPATQVCYHGGLHALTAKLLEPSKKDGRCITFDAALGHSANVPFARLADRHLDPTKLGRVAADFGFNAPLQVDGLAVEGSPAKLPEGRFEFAQAAAGFSPEVRLSALQGARMAAIVGQGGLAPSLSLIEAIDGIETTPAGAPTRVLDAAVADALDGMMRRTVTEGTARRAFRERRKEALPGIAVAGKTGSLDTDAPYRDNTWFIGYAPAEAPTIAVAAVVVNGPKWRIRAPYVAREALRVWLFGSKPYRPSEDRVVAEAPKAGKGKRGRRRG